MDAIWFLRLLAASPGSQPWGHDKFLFWTYISTILYVDLFKFVMTYRWSLSGFWGHCQPRGYSWGHNNFLILGLHTKFQPNLTIHSIDGHFLVFMATGSLEVRQKIMTNFNFSHIHKVSAQSEDWILRYIFLKIVKGDFWGPFFACCPF